MVNRPRMGVTNTQIWTDAIRVFVVTFVDGCSALVCVLKLFGSLEITVILDTDFTERTDFPLYFP